VIVKRWRVDSDDADDCEVLSCQWQST
jgi:hypothetical protein